MVHTAVNAALGAALFAASIAEGSAFVPSSGRLPVASKAASLSAARVGAHPASWNRRLRATNLNMVAAQPKEEKTGLGWDSHVVRFWPEPWSTRCWGISREREWGVGRILTPT